MSKKEMTPEEVGEIYSELWWSEHPDIYDDLIRKIENPNYIVKCHPAHVNRAVLTCKYVLQHVRPGGRVLDMACGIGYIANCLAGKGYKVEGFDISKKGIERTKDLARKLGNDPEMFTVSDHRYLLDLPDESFDAVVAMGFFRYLDRDTQTECYRQVHRILKTGGKFPINHQNMLFEMFALNDGTLQFWANIIEGFSEAPRLLGKKTVMAALKDKVTVPNREFSDKSLSKNMTTQSENPLAYAEVAADHGFRLEKICFAASHLLPPFLEKQVNQNELLSIKRDVCLDRANDWRAMFMDYEFVAYLEKV